MKDVAIASFGMAEEYLGKKDERPLPGKATRLIRQSDNVIVVRFHETNIVTYARNWAYTLNSGGWRTPITRDRINAYLPGRIKIVAGEDGVWYLHSDTGKHVFADGMIVYFNGLVKGAGTMPLVTGPQIAKYVERMLRGIESRKISGLSDGINSDWDRLSNEDMAADILAGTPNVAIIWTAFDDETLGGALRWTGIIVQCFFNLMGDPVGSGWNANWVRSQAKRMVTNYLRRELGLSWVAPRNW